MPTKEQTDRGGDGAEDTPKKRTRKPLPDGVAGYLVGLGIRVPVPAELVELAKQNSTDAGTKRVALFELINQSILSASRDADAELTARHRAQRLGMYRKLRDELSREGALRDGAEPVELGDGTEPVERVEPS